MFILMLLQRFQGSKLPPPPTHIVGTYSPGKELVVYEMSIHVFPTEPSPTTTHFMSRSVFAILQKSQG